jgi:hypothetical protein
MAYSGGLGSVSVVAIRKAWLYSLQTESIPATWAQRANRDSKLKHQRRRNKQTKVPKRGRKNKACINSGFIGTAQIGELDEMPF